MFPLKFRENIHSTLCHDIDPRSKPMKNYQESVHRNSSAVDNGIWRSLVLVEDLLHGVADRGQAGNVTRHGEVLGVTQSLKTTLCSLDSFVNPLR